MGLKKAIGRLGISRAATAPPASSVQPIPSEQLVQTRLQKSKRTEPLWRRSTYIEEGAEFPNLCAVGDDQADGLWVCHRCSNENPVVHYTGPHSFNYVVCRICCDGVRRGEDCAALAI
ncbi:hypothetical protein CC86DRAFT_88003 [Ophiobolus disseminans]|uniref:Probable double zinc ribbon domain-containing protein n=1 Tax=Ophiobolus disseminans TaxID=1469910 RepID=A0A6A7AG33_9PLEO|nr:hypothetical protein CC86DRAFT_88003 [Ophiobolus disseminans]